MGENPNARGKALRDSTGQGCGLSWIGSEETSAFLQTPRLTAEERFFLPASRLPPVHSRSSVSPPGGDEYRFDPRLKGTTHVFLALLIIMNKKGEVMTKQEKLLEDVFESALQNDMNYVG
jgi:hypothetical protein